MQKGPGFRVEGVGVAPPVGVHHLVNNVLDGVVIMDLKVRESGSMPLFGHPSYPFPNPHAAELPDND